MAAVTDRDVVIASLQKLMPGYKETFTKFHPAFDHLIEKGNKTKLTAPFLQFVVVPEGPGTLNSVVTGEEHIDGGRRQTSVRGTAYAATMIYAYDIPFEDYRQLSGKDDIANLIRKYPERALADFQEMIARQLVLGDQPGAEQFFTLNGEATYNPKGALSNNGMLEFLAPSSQTSDRFGITSNQILGWHNQYRHVTSVSANGYKQMRGAYWDASLQGAQDSGDVDIMIADRDSFDNLIDELQDYVQFVNREKDIEKGDPAPRRVRRGLEFQNGVIYPEPQLDTTVFTASQPQDGVIYGLKTDTLHLFTQGSSMNKETTGDFDYRAVGRIGHQELDRHEIVLSMGAYCDDLRCNFAVTGTAIP